MSLQSYPPKLRPYIFYGLSLGHYPGDNGAKGICPFCHDSSFYVRLDRNREGFVCNSCMESGNIYSFIRTLYKYSKELWDKSDISQYNYPFNMKKDKLASFMAAKNLTLSDIERWGIVPSYINMDPLLPLYNKEDALANLTRLCSATVKGKQKWIPYGMPGGKQHPFRLKGPVPGQSVWIVEGYSDTLNAERFVRQEGLDIGVIGVWGAHGLDLSIFPDYVGDRASTLIFDNDYPKVTLSGKINRKAKDGIDEIFRGVKDLKPRPIVDYVQWGSNGSYHTKELPDGYDLSDLITDTTPGSLPLRILNMRRSPRPASSPVANAAKARGSRNGKTAFSNKNTQTGTPAKQKPKIKPIPCTSFNTLVKAFEERLHFTQNLKDTLAVALASVVSTPLDGDQLWFRLIGPPGAGKTTIAEAVSAATDYIYPLSLQTGFHSGHQDLQDKDKDFSLLSEMNNKTCIIKDADTLLKSNALDRILAEMRDFYDGVSRAKYRNGVTHTYEDLRITFLLCGTDALRSLNRTEVGERFLDCEVFGDDDAKPYIRRAFANTYNLVTNSMAQSTEPSEDAKTHADRIYLKALTAGFINHLRTQMSRRQPPRFTDHASESLMGMAEFIAIIRARTKRDKDTEEYVKSRVEVPTRLISQLTKAAICLAIVKERSSIDDEVLRICRKLTFDTTDSTQLEIVKVLHQHDDGHGLACRTIAHHVRLSEAAVITYLKQLRYFGAVDQIAKSNNSGQRGRDVHHWKLSKIVEEVYDISLDPIHRKPAKPTPAVKPTVRRPTPKKVIKK